MERHESASIELVAIDEDVIAASSTSCEQLVDHDGRVIGWNIFYPDGSNDYSTDPNKPSVCP